ncbi:cytochrome b [Falsirhodobacter algicola]|uniref:Cytochrome b n=1 Tax=Falsirhodobacter algicola TaxID=2692330 RepID=A0A8J8SLG5_9RHOB|nr:cytochrome b N-terminal domain-containing protein [Falsirhodobacter algicola]QUS36389.1 cytochrome b [Falsirhodobacter algicola]
MTRPPHPPYRPQSAAARWLQARLPILGLLHGALTVPVPRNLNWMWVWGVVLMFCLLLQLATGLALAMHYIPQAELAFDSVQRIMRDVNGGAFLRALHANGASLFFLGIYAHIFRGIYYGSGKAPREVTWLIGMTLFLLLMATAFMGYVLPWGQMSFWGATVITNLIGEIPGIGPTLEQWVLGGPTVGDPTLTRFYVLHYALPFVAVALVGLHVWSFHSTGNSNPSGVEPRTDPEGFARDTLPFWPFFVIKDLLALAVVLAVFFALAGFAPDLLGHPENAIPADPLVTPPHIVPEWYFLPFYAILRAFTDDLWLVRAVEVISFGHVGATLCGAAALAGSILVLVAAPWLDRSPVRSGRYRPAFRVCFVVLLADFALLMWCGAQPPTGMVAFWSLIGTAVWFGFFLIALPLLPRWERPRPLPPTIEEAR